MAQVQHNAEISSARQFHLENTTANRPTAAQSEKTEEELKRYTCLYFGYASNLSPVTLKQRCPDSLFISLATLPGYRWIINETGYANIVPSSDPADHVWGSLCFLSYRDEMALDESEGVPWLYERHKVKVKRVPQHNDSDEWKAGGGEEVEATAYVDVQRLTEGKIEKEYVTWVTKAIEDADACGMPREYADKYLRPYLPAKGDMSDQEIMMVRTTQRKDQEGKPIIPKGFASWQRG